LAGEAGVTPGAGPIESEKLRIFRRWLQQGQRDLGAAEVLRQNDVYEWATFLEHQAAERVLKAYLYYHDEASVMGHSIRTLVLKCRSRDEAFEAVHDAGKLDDFYSAPRFPDSFGEEVPAYAVTPEQAEVAVAVARKAVELVNKLAPEEG
jgi:HEPN domain-containing protein